MPSRRRKAAPVSESSSVSSYYSCGRSSSVRSKRRQRRYRSRSVSSRSSPTPLRKRAKKEEEKRKEKEKEKEKDKEKPKDKQKEKKEDKEKDKTKSKDKEKEKEKDKDKDKEKAEPSGDKKKDEEEKTAEDGKEKKTDKPKTPGINGLGDLLALQQSLSQDAERLQLFLLQAKRELDDRKETQDKQERREKEYYRGSFGEPVGPGNRLLLEDALGQGAFSTVYGCRDMQAKAEDKRYAVKFIRKNNMLRRATEREVKLMRRLRLQASEKDAEGAACFLGLAGPEVFEHEGHLALCFQLQKCDLRSGLRKYGQGKGLPLSLVRSYARNIFMALRALRQVNVIHSDLKPDNLLISLDKASVKLSDFGSAMDVADKVKGEKAADSLQPRFYRAPEVILGQSYDTQIDVWSAGCTVFELATGRFLFTGRTNNEMLHDMQRHLGAFPRAFCTAGAHAARHFSPEDCAFRLGADSANAVQLIARDKFPRPAKPLMEPLSEAVQVDGASGPGSAGSVAAKALGELVVMCVMPDPASRATPETALASRFLRPSGLSSSGGAQAQ